MPKKIKKTLKTNKNSSTHDNQKRRLNITEQMQIVVDENLSMIFNVIKMKKSTRIS